MSDRIDRLGAANAERGGEHVAFDALNDYVDGILAAPERAAIERHLALCSRCAAELDELCRVIAVAAEAPRSILPPGDLWPELRTELERRKEIPLPVRFTATAPRAAARTGGRWTRRDRAILAAAAIVLVALSSAVPALVVRSPGAQLAGLPPDAAATMAPGGTDASAVLPAAFRASEDDYLRTIGELRATRDARRDRLSPETIATVERSLALIDSAIAEARAALVDDPRNVTLVELLSATYERKLDLLKRASELAST